MSESQFAGHTENHLNPLPMGAGPNISKAVPKEVPVKSFMHDLCTSLGFTADPHFLNYAAFEWLTQEGYLMAQHKESRQCWNNQPAPKGAGLGLRSAQFTAADGKAYSEIVCGEQGQMLLRDSIGQIIALERMQWEPLLACLTPKWHSRVPVSEEPLLITAMVKQINSCLPGDLPRVLSAAKLGVWLVKNGLMETILIGKSKRRYPTEAGEKIGIRCDPNRDRSVLWTAPAQRFLCDNLDGIVQDLASGEAYRWGPREPVLTEELRSKLRPVSKPIQPAYLETVINANLRGEEEYPDILPKRFLAVWLYQEKYSVFRADSGEGRKEWSSFPTEEGEKIGLIVSEGQLLLSETAQQFIYDNLQRIFDYCKTL
ncbi:MAG: hypothetical protein HDT33_07225 [Clostridiales bacterium]|nr:hypothetical protein [Clostridiales bacterium]